MSRYASTKQIKDENGIRRASTTILPIPPASDSDIYIQVTSPERLDILAFKFYADASLWWVIANANGLGKGNFDVPENTRIRIPDSSTVQDLIEKTNNSR